MTESSHVRGYDEALKLMHVAEGKHAADLAVVNATLLNVYTGELLENWAICTCGKWIAYVGEEPDPCLGDSTKVIDAEGRTVIPGFIDGHTHNAWLVTAEAFLEYAMRGGTTTIITEVLEIYPMCGLAGVLDFLSSLRDQPIKFFTTAPIMVSTSSAVSGISPEDLGQLLDRDDVIGLGESYWQDILQTPDRFLPAMIQAMRKGAVLEGHTAGAKGRNLMAYLTTGVSSCHEPINQQEVLDRLRLGLYVMVREGGIRKDLEAIAGIKDANVDLRRVILATDSVAPDELVEKGYMELIVQKAIDLGIDPVAAVQMATLNVAEHFRLDHLIGGIAPGRYADMIVVPDIRTIRAEAVISNGSIIAENGELQTRPRSHTFSHESMHSIRLARELKPEDFAIDLPARGSNARARVMDMVTDLVTLEHHMDVTVDDGRIRARPEENLLKAAAVDRTNSPGKTFTGLIKGFGLRSGAFACSASWDTADIIVVGAADEDMALAVNRIAQLQGGAVLCDKGRVLEELPLPIFGIMSELSLREATRKKKALVAACRGLGMTFRDPVLSLITLTGAAIPFLRICEEGLVNLKDGKHLGLFVD
ncbi:MAG: adenine deaminase [Deltaproteobacteria bacterium]|nr:adenine deaminase [Deltaproteobacteria bacterium]MBW1817998.1 adenine deaminase [Deltaproteobacteria bacterium]MBW2284680.1 adenine deaminase [Deltaproteobacteria bacterium]